MRVLLCVGMWERVGRGIGGRGCKNVVFCMCMYKVVFGWSVKERSLIFADTWWYNQVALKQCTQLPWKMMFVCCVCIWLWLIASDLSRRKNFLEFTLMIVWGGFQRLSQLKTQSEQCLLVRWKRFGDQHQCQFYRAVVPWVLTSNSDTFEIYSFSHMQTNYSWWQQEN